MDSRLAATEYTDTRAMVFGAKEENIRRCVEKYTIPHYVEQEAIRALYDFRLWYDSCVFERQKQIALEASH